MARDSSECEDSIYQKYKLQRMNEINKQINSTRVTTYNNEYTLIQKSKKDTMIVHFFDEKFRKCKIMDKNLEKVVTYFKGIEFARIDANFCPTFTKKLNIGTLPFLAFFKDGFYVDQAVGFEGFGKETFEVEDLVKFIKNSEMFK
ncbi:hypothetical protein GVAV_003094 [Gurleya vavrai]